MSGIAFLFVVFFGVVGVGIITLSRYQERQRTEQMEVVAGRMGFSFRPEAEPGLQDQLGPFHLFSQGHSRKIRNVLRREIHDIGATLFDYRYRTSSGKHSQTHWQTVLLFHTRRLQLPLFSLRPKGVLHRIAGVFGYQDIAFELHPVFSETYLLRGFQEAEIRDLFSEEALCYYARYGELCTEGDGQQLIFYERGRRMEPGRMEGFLEQGLDVLDLFMKRESLLGAVPWLDDDLGVVQGGLAQPAVVETEIQRADTVDEMLAQLEVGWWE